MLRDSIHRRVNREPNKIVFFFIAILYSGISMLKDIRVYFNCVSYIFIGNWINRRSFNWRRFECFPFQDMWVKELSQLSLNGSMILSYLAHHGRTASKQCWTDIVSFFTLKVLYRKRKSRFFVNLSQILCVDSTVMYYFM